MTTTDYDTKIKRNNNKSNLLTFLIDNLNYILITSFKSILYAMC